MSLKLSSNFAISLHTAGPFWLLQSHSLSLVWLLTAKSFTGCADERAFSGGEMRFVLRRINPVTCAIRVLKHDASALRDEATGV